MLHVHRSEQADVLAAALAEVLREPPADAFAPEVVAVPARGVERWLTQRLSHVLGAGAGQDGVCANVQFPRPAGLVGDAVTAASGVTRGDDVWDVERTVWTLLDVIDSCAGEAWCSALAGHLGLDEGGDPHRRGRRLTAARHIAALFSSYGAYRPAMVREWAADADADGAGSALDGDVRWQAELWRRLRQRLGVTSPAERLDAACGVLRQEPGVVDLPERLSLFGPTRLTADQLAVLAALAEQREVHLWLSHPSPALWETVRERAGAVGAGGPVRRRLDPTRAVAQHPLLSSLGREIREMQLTLGGLSAAAPTSTPATPVVEHLHDVASRPATLLGRLQDDLSRDHRPPGPPIGDATDERTLLDPADRSVQVHACHGPARQVEVLREVLLGLLAGDPTLEPRDVLVMCPDVETYAPLVSATFGLDEAEDGTGHPGHRLRVRLADRSLRRTNPLLDLLAALLDLADARVTASQVLDLAGTPPVRRRFGFDDDDVERLRDWVSRSGVRWGLDAAHRAPFGLRRVGQNTWGAGLDRILLGVSMAEDELRWLGLALPLDDVDSGDIDLAGRLAELVDRLAATLGALSGEQSLANWLDALSLALDSLADVVERDAWQLAQARAELTEVREAAGERAGHVRLTLADIRALLAERLQGRPTRAGFRTGTLTVCSMVPMRSVPHRVICLLGLDDGAFPRGAGVDGDDVLARDPCVGERDRRAEDRQLLLDAVLAARDTLVVLYSGADERTNAANPPAVPVGEILDVLDATVRTADGRALRESLVVRHPLQPFDARNFIAGQLGTPGPFSFDPSSLQGARRAAGGSRGPEPAFLPGPLPAMEVAATVELAELISFLEHPVRGFLRQRLGVVVRSDDSDDSDVTDALSVELEPLDRWEVGDRMLTARLAGAASGSCEAAEWRRGSLPPGPLGKEVLERLRADVEPLVVAASDVRSGEPGSVDVAVPLPDGRLLTGTIGGIHARSVLRVVYSKLGPKHRLRAWTQLLAVAATEQGQWQAVTIGRGQVRGVRRSTLTGPSAKVAASTLGELVDLRDRGLREPLPLTTVASHVYASRRESGGSVEEALEAAEREWTGTYGEATDRHHEMVWDAEPALGVLLRAAPGEDERTAPWPTDEQTRFGMLARRLWTPLLTAERTELG